MQKYVKTDGKGMTYILSDMVIIPENKETGDARRVYMAGTPEYIEYAAQNGFTLTDTVDNSLPSVSEIDDMTRGEKDEVLKKILKRI